ncbi:HAD family hydrolase [Desulfogranum marinum]|uniref:HAD family hydrolase n=1 Tax=Desulfogranum marinum TaxID=453220 RepID=UPI001964879E|nr:HAD family hydrolase [Desulfogranum marinum]MBM9513478.1 haloacid dehalogenase-like hydrolase [Desulfogranum marinum]
MKPLITIVLYALITANLAYGNEALRSWNDTHSKQQIISFVEAVTIKESKDFVPIPERIAVFDNDGTLWVEQPAYTQLIFAMDRVKEMAGEHPHWKNTHPFKAVLEDDHQALVDSGAKGIMQLVMATHSGMNTEEFSSAVETWVKKTKDSRFGQKYPDLVYQPMLELLEYLRDNGFKIYIVSGGGVEFMRTFAEKVYGIPPEQVIGSSVKTQFEIVNGVPQLKRLPEIFHFDDKEGKPIAIQTFIGRRPILAFGNSDGDLQMLQWTAAGKHKSFCGLVHHTDAEREYAYDRESHVGKLDKAWKEADEKGWVLVDMKKEWKHVFSFDKQ